MINQPNCNKVQLEYFIPMGKPGSLIIKAPVVLSTIKITLPLSTNFTLDKDSINVCTRLNKFILKELTLNSDNELLVSGSLIKSIDSYITTFDNPLIKRTDLDIPINEKINIDFGQICLCPSIESTHYIQQDYQSISFNLDYIEVIEDSIFKENDTYYIELLFSLNISITQIQNVFIPEPEGNFSLVSNNSMVSFLEYQTSSHPNHIVGYTQETGLIAKKISTSDI